MHEINIMHIWDTLTANIKSNQIELASVVSPPFAVESAVVAYALDVDTCSPFCGETLLLPLLP